MRRIFPVKRSETIATFRVLLGLPLFIGLLHAQSTTATLVGRIDDQTGSPIGGVRLVVKNVNTNEVRAVETNPEGDYTVTNLSPGSYELMAEKEGFQRALQTGIILQVEQVARIDLQLKVGSVSESVEVTASIPLLNTENPMKGEVIVQEEIQEMPLEDRDFGDLAFLVPGVARRARGGSGSRFAVNGTRSDNTSFMVDGIHDQNSRGGGIQVRPPVSAMQEFKMQTSGYGAEYGRYAGGVMNMVLKTGGNKFHGHLFEFLRDDAFDARNYFAREKPDLRRNHFGATLDGPVWLPRLYNGRDRTFFLFSVEGYRNRVGQIRRALVPLEAERAGDFSQSFTNTGKPIFLRDPLASGTCDADSQGGCFPGNRIPVSRMNPASLKLVPYYPMPNLTGERNNLYVVGNDRDNWHTLLIKIDQRVFGSDNISFRYLARKSDLSNPFDGSATGTFASKTNELQALFGLTYTKVFSPTVINEFRAGFTRTSNHETSVHSGRNYSEEFGITGTTTDPKLIGFPRITVRDLVALGDAEGLPVRYTVNNFQWADSLTWVRPRHLIKFGGDVLRTQFFQIAASKNRGVFNFLDRWTGSPFGDFLLGMPNSTSRQIGTTPSYMFSTSYGFFLQDDFKASSSLTLNFGVRYEILKPPVEKYGRMGNFVPELGKFILADDRNVADLDELIAWAGLQGRIGTAREFGLPPSLIYTPYNNVAPRFGIAWRPGRSNRMVIRGGYGIFFGSSRLDNVRSDLAVVFPFAVLQTFNRQANNPNFITLTNGFPSRRGTLEGVNNSFGYEVHAPTQYLQSWNLTVERQLGQQSAIEIAYVGSKGTHLGRRYDLNQPLRQPELRMANGNFPRPYREFNTIQYYSFGSNSIYNAGIVSVRRRFAGGFFYRASYVFSKSIDDASQISGAGNGGYAGAQDARNLKLERGRSDWDNGHSFTMSMSYNTPWRHLLLRSWQLSSTSRMYTGQPFTVKTSNVDLNAGEANRPDRIAKGRLKVRTTQRWFDLAAFAPVPAGSYRPGNSGRNILDGPGEVRVNLSLGRKFQVRERHSLQFRWELFNVANKANFGLPNENFNAVNGGVITSADAPRSMQFGLRYQF